VGYDFPVGNCLPSDRLKVLGIAWHSVPDGKQLAAAGHDGKMIGFWSCIDGKELFKLQATRVM